MKDEVFHQYIDLKIALYLEIVDPNSQEEYVSNIIDTIDHIYFRMNEQDAEIIDHSIGYLFKSKDKPLEGSLKEIDDMISGMQKTHKQLIYTYLYASDYINCIYSLFFAENYLPKRRALELYTVCLLNLEMFSLAKRFERKLNGKPFSDKPKFVFI